MVLQMTGLSLLFKGEPTLQGDEKVSTGHLQMENPDVAKVCLNTNF